MTYNAGERKDVRAAEKAAKIAESQSAEIIRSLMSIPPGRAWVLTLLESAHVFATSFDRDPVAMAFNEGERNQGLILLTAIMSACPDQFLLMMKERNERHLAGERSRSSNGLGGNQGPIPDDPGPDSEDDGDSASRH